MAGGRDIASLIPLSGGDTETVRTRLSYERSGFPGDPSQLRKGYRKQTHGLPGLPPIIRVTLGNRLKAAMIACIVHKNIDAVATLPYGDGGGFNTLTTRNVEIHGPNRGRLLPCCDGCFLDLFLNQG